MSLKTLQKQVGATVDGAFGKQTFGLAQEHFGMTDIQAVHFFAQVAHETGEFKLFEENLNYSHSGLLKIFGKYFNEEKALEYKRQPEKIANLVYANRMGNGDEASGDGWKFRGRGAIQLTGKDNYEAFSKYMSNPEILECPEDVEDRHAFHSAIFFFKNSLIFTLCTDLTEETVKRVTRRINGGYNGLEHRLELTNKYAKYIT
jgi:putative chitinase